MAPPTTWLEQPLARFRGIVEGSYVTGGVVIATPGTFKSTRLHGDLDDEEFPLAHFHRGYDCVVGSSSWMEPEGAQSHCATVRRVAEVVLRVGYLFGRDHPLAHSLGVTSRGVASELGHADHEKLERVLSHPKNWGGCTPQVCAILRAGPVQTAVLEGLSRLIVSAPYRVLVAYAAGTFT